MSSRTSRQMMSDTAWYSVRLALSALILLAVNMGGCPAGPADTIDPADDTPGTGANSVSSTFDSGDEGWTVSGDAQDESAVPTYKSTGGNPGGYVEAADSMTSGVWYWRAPAKFHGDFSSAYGKTLKYDLVQSSTVPRFSSADVWLVSSTKVVVLFGYQDPGTTWTSYSVDLSESAGWSVGDVNGPAAAAEDMQAVLGDLQDIFIRGEFLDSPDIGGLDNVVLYRD